LLFAIDRNIGIDGGFVYNERQPGARSMDLIFVIPIVGAVLIGGLIALRRYRGFDGYRRRFANGAGKFGRKTSRAGAAQDSSVYTVPFVVGADGHHHSHGPADCGASHGGDAGGGCSDGGGGSGS
jgi:hypothetical protein